MKEIATYRFWPLRWHKAWCHLCGSIVKRKGMERHSEYHFKNEDFYEMPLNPARSGHLDITIHLTKSDRLIVSSSGWITDGSGPQ